MTKDIETLLPQLLEGAVPQPPEALDGRVVRQRAEAVPLTDLARHRAIRRYCAMAAAAVVVAVLAVVVSLRFGASHHPRPIAGQLHPPVSSAPSAPANHSPKAQTERAVRALLSETPKYPGSRSTTSAPSAYLRSGPGDFPSPNAVDVHRFATTSAEAPSVLNYYDRKLRGIGGTPNVTHITLRGVHLTEHGYLVEGSEWNKPSVYHDLELIVTVTQVRSGVVGFRIDAHAVWLPRRPSASYLNVPVKTVVVRQWHDERINRALGSRWANALAKRINNLPGVTPVAVENGCGPRIYHDVLIFRGTTSSTRVEISGACEGLTVFSGSKPVPFAMPGTIVDILVGKALGASGR